MELNKIQEIRICRYENQVNELLRDGWMLLRIESGVLHKWNPGDTDTLSHHYDVVYHDFILGRS
jgi:hypothetical protein